LERVRLEIHYQADRTCDIFVPNPGDGDIVPAAHNWRPSVKAPVGGRVQAFDVISFPLFETNDSRARAERKISTRTMR